MQVLALLAAFPTNPGIVLLFSAGLDCPIAKVNILPF